MTTLEILRAARALIAQPGSPNAILAEDDCPALTPERVKELLKRAAAGSDELMKQTRQAFGLSQQSAGLRLGDATIARLEGQERT